MQIVYLLMKKNLKLFKEMDISLNQIKLVKICKKNNKKFHKSQIIQKS